MFPVQVVQSLKLKFFDQANHSLDYKSLLDRWIYVEVEAASSYELSEIKKMKIEKGKVMTLKLSVA